jgi:hypothetical protein
VSALESFVLSSSVPVTEVVSVAYEGRELSG